MIIFVGVQSPPRAVIREAGFEAHHAETVGEALGLIASLSEAPTLTVVRTTVARATRDGPRLRDAAPDAQLLFLLPPDELNRFRAGLPFMPQLRRALSASAAAPAEELVQMIGNVADAEGARRAHGDVMARINRQLAQGGPDKRPLPAGQDRLSERFFATLLATAPDAFFALDPQGRFLALNDAAAKLFGIGDTLDDQMLGDIIGVSEDTELEDLLKRTRAGEIIRQIDLPLRKIERRRDRWVELSLAPVFDEAGRLESISATARDVTRRRQEAAQLAALNESLEARVEAVVAEREFAQAALLQSQKMEAMGQLTGGVAHDFNNLLTPIMGVLDLLQRRSSNSEREARLIDGAMQSAERAKTLVQRLLAFARRQPLQAAPVDLAKLVAGMADLIASTSGPQIRVVAQIDEGLDPAVADANQLEMAILNLAVNARDAMPNGGTLTVALSAAPAPETIEGPLKGKPALRLTVSDTGLGMDEQTLAHAVEPFYSTKGIGKGTGLGLSMVHGLTRQLGGGMTIASKQGFGTRIDLWLPTSSTPVVENGRSASMAQSREKLRGRVLVVDDEDAVRLSTMEMLENLGYQAFTAIDAAEAERRLRDGEEFDLIVTDHLMPGLTGADLAERIRSAWPKLPVLIVSGYAEVDGIAAGFARLAKPFREAELAEAIGALAGGQS
jgi:PAS domain S-box-containing protein